MSKTRRWVIILLSLLALILIGLNLANRLNGFIPGWNRVFFFVNVIGVMLLLEVLCIAVINRFFPVLSGRGRKKC